LGACLVAKFDWQAQEAARAGMDQAAKEKQILDALEAQQRRDLQRIADSLKARQDKLAADRVTAQRFIERKFAELAAAESAYYRSNGRFAHDVDQINF